MSEKVLGLKPMANLLKRWREWPKEKKDMLIIAVCLIIIAVILSIVIWL